eukprot:gene57886-biopygen63129
MDSTPAPTVVPPSAAPESGRPRSNNRSPAVPNAPPLPDPASPAVVARIPSDKGNGIPGSPPTLPTGRTGGMKWQGAASVGRKAYFAPYTAPSGYAVL